MAATKSYVVRATRFGHVRNLAQVEKAVDEGRVVPPVAAYVPFGGTVDLDPDHPRTVAGVASGAIEEPGAARERERDQLNARLEALKVEQAQLEDQQPAKPKQPAKH